MRRRKAFVLKDPAEQEYAPACRVAAVSYDVKRIPVDQTLKRIGAPPDPRSQ
jgi:hypothetical protein